MVYCGRPSASCANCRAKKRRCDKAIPACGQCRRMGQNCPGYRDPTSLLFRNENSRIIEKVNIRQAKSSRVFTFATLVDEHNPITSSESPPSASPPHVDCPSFSTPSIAYCSPSTPLTQPSVSGSSGKNEVAEEEADSVGVANGTETATLTYASDLAWLPAPSENLRDLGVNYFLSNYVVPKSGPSPGFLSYTFDLLKDSESNTSLVEDVIRAVGLAGIANAVGGGSTVMHAARKSYAEALRKVNQALSSPFESRKDSTVLAVVALGLFESVTCSSEESLDAWSRHIDGAASLLSYRGTAQFTTQQGLQIFQEVVAHLLMSTSRLGRPVSPKIRLLRAEATPYIPPEPPSWVVSGTHIEVMDLAAKVDWDIHEPFLKQEWETLLSRAVELDRRLESLFDNERMEPTYWRYKTVSDPNTNPRVVWHGIYSVYDNTWVAKIWNNTRSCRIILNLVICCLLEREGRIWAPETLEPHGPYGDLVVKSMMTALCMRDAILASVPQLMGFVTYDAITGVMHLERARNPNEVAFVLASGAYFLQWHLYLVGALPFTDSETRGWTIDRLRVIRSSAGIQKAQFLADNLEREASFTFQRSTPVTLRSNVMSAG